MHGHSHQSHGHVHSEHCQHDHGHTSHEHEHGPSAVDTASLAESLANPGKALAETSPADLLVMAVRSGSREMCEGVVAKHPEALQGRDSEDGATAVHWAALTGNCEMVEWLVNAGAPVDVAVESSGMQPIHWAATRGHTDLVKLLLKFGANVDAKDVKGTTALVVASQCVGRRSSPRGLATPRPHHTAAEPGQRPPSLPLSLSAAQVRPHGARLLPRAEASRHQPAGHVRRLCPPLGRVQGKPPSSCHSPSPSS